MHTFNPLTDLPSGLDLTPGQSRRQLEFFSSLSPDEQRQVIDGTHSIRTQRELKSYLGQLAPEFLLPF